MQAVFIESCSKLAKLRLRPLMLRPRFRLSSLMLGVACFCALCSMIAANIQETIHAWNEEQEVTRYIESVGGIVKTKLINLYVVNYFVATKYLYRISEIEFNYDKLSILEPSTRLYPIGNPIKRIVSLAYLRSIAVKGKTFSDDDVRELCTMHKLEKIYLENVSVTDSGLSLLALAIPCLEDIVIDNSDLVTGACLSDMVHCKRLKRLTLTSGKLSGPMVRDFSINRPDVTFTFGAFRL